MPDPKLPPFASPRTVVPEEKTVGEYATLPDACALEKEVDRTTEASIIATINAILILEFIE
jgi:hypothetical protein